MTHSTAMMRRHFLGGTAFMAALATTGVARAELAAPGFASPWTGGGTVARAGGIINYRTLGPEDGEPVVLLHKVGGWIADWRSAAPFIADAGYRVIAMDLPGHGDSVMLGRPPYVQTVSESAAMLLAALSEIGIDRFAVAGNSLGGIVGLNMAARWPERIRALVLASVSLYEGQSREELADVEEERDGEVWTSDWRPLPRTMEQVSRFGTINPEIESEQNASRARADRWVRPSERGVALSNAAELLARTTVPALLIYADRGYYTKYVAIGRNARPDAAIVQIEEAGSFVHQEKPHETADAMVAFLNGLS